MSRLIEKINKNKMQSDTHPLNCSFDLTEGSVCLSKAPNLHHRRLIKVARPIVRSYGTSVYRRFLEGFDFGFFILERLSTEVRKIMVILISDPLWTPLFNNCYSSYYILPHFSVHSLFTKTCIILFVKVKPRRRYF